MASRNEREAFRGRFHPQRRFLRPGAVSKVFSRCSSIANFILDETGLNDGLKDR